MNEMKLDALPEAAKIELMHFYEYLIYKYLKKIERLNRTAAEENDKKNEHVAAFNRFKKLRDQGNLDIDRSIDIDKLCNEVNRDIF